MAATRQGQREKGRRHDNYELKPTTQMPTECVPGCMTISPTKCLSVSKTIQKISKSQSKISPRGLPRPTLSLNPNFGQTASPEKRKIQKNWSPKSDQICAKISPRGSLKRFLFQAHFCIDFDHDFHAFLTPKSLENLTEGNIYIHLAVGANYRFQSC